MQLSGFASFLAISITTGAALAHHPGSHATRQKDGQVKIEVVAIVGESCLGIGAVRIGTPPSILPPPGATPVTAQVERVGTACAPGAQSIRAERLVEVGREVRQFHLYVVGPDGAVAGSERIPVR